MIVVRSVVSALVLFVSLATFAAANYPDGPNPVKTPGSICTDSPVKRYKEQITYCERDVSSDLKRSLIVMYDRELGYHIATMSRNDFKIDHFIPLSIGGSNEAENLWPQHKSVYQVTDPLEHLLGQKISEGRIKQADAIRVVREAKLNLGRVPDLIHYVQGL